MENICVIIRSLANGGAEKQSLLLAKALQKHHNTFMVAVSDNPAHKKHLDFIEREGINFTFLTGNAVAKVLQLSSFLKKNHIDTIFSYLPSDTLFAAIGGKMAGVKHLYGGVRNAKMPGKKLQVLKLLHNHVLDYSIANCYSGKDNFVEKGFRPDNMIVLPNALELNQELILREEKKELTILSVGRFVPQKDYHTAIKAIAELSHQLDGKYALKYHIVGYGELENELRQWIADCQMGSNVKLIINPANIWDYYESADIYLCTSLFEGLSNAIMEAMSYSLPIIATRAGDNDRLVRPNENGYLVNTEDVATIISYLKELIASHELRLQYGKKSYDIIKDEYTFQAFQQNYLNLINTHKGNNLVGVAN